MKKNFALYSLVMTIVLFGAVSYAVNMPSAPVSYSRPVAKTPAYAEAENPNAIATPRNSGGSQSLDSLAMSALKAAENRNNQQMNVYIRRMAEKGVTAINTPQIVAKRTPHCPPIRMELNGRQLSGSLCARMGYEYKGKMHDIGYCK